MIIRSDDNTEKSKESRVVSPSVTSSETSEENTGEKGDTGVFENKLRPLTFGEYVGQQKIKQNLTISIKACKKRKEPIEHILLHGSPGLGKTTLASIIAKEMGVSMKITSGPTLEKQGDLAAIISNLSDNDVLFIDEIHRIRPAVEEILYTAMEDFGIDIVLGKGPSAKSMRINLPKFTLIGATTKVSMLSAPLRDRFGHNFRLDFYNTDDIRAIVNRSAGILDCKIEDSAAELLSHCSRQTPRIANRLLKRVRDYADYHDADVIGIEIVKKALDALGVDMKGLDHVDREILFSIIDKFRGGPVGLNTIAASTSEEQATIEDIYEPYLIKLGMLERTSRGRIATPRAYEHLGIEEPLKT